MAKSPLTRIRGNTAPGTNPGLPPRDQTPGATGKTPNGPQVPLPPPQDPPLTLTPTVPLPIPLPSSAVVPPPPRGGGSGGGGSSGPAAPPPPPGLYGTLTAPTRLLSGDGAAIISNNGSSVISNGGAKLISNNGGGLVSDQGGSLLGKVRLYRAAGPEAPRYALLAAEPHRALTQAFLYLTNRDERFFLDSQGKVLATTVDGAGRFQFASGYPLGQDVVVNAWLNDNLRLTGFIVPAGSSNEINLNLGSTMATELLRGDAFRRGRSLVSYAFQTFREVAVRTQDAIVAGILPSVLTEIDETNQPRQVARFDLRAERTENLRNQYVVALTAAEVTNATLRAISDLWKTLLGERPTAITSILGNGEAPTVEGNLANFTQLGFASGDVRDGSLPKPLTIPLGFNYGVAVSHTRNAYGGRDVFISCATAAGSSGHIRWLRLDAAGALRKVTSLWLPTYALGQPLGICIEREPSADPANPGSLLVADPGVNKIMRVFMVDQAVPGSTLYEPGHPLAGVSDPFDHDNDPSTPPASVTFPIERHRVEVVAGEDFPLNNPTDPFYGFISREHPLWLGFLNSSEASFPDYMASQTLVLPTNYASATTSNWRTGDEGPRNDVNGNPIPNPARYAHIEQPWDVEVDELGNIYIADKGNHRIRMIPKVTGRYFNYETPLYNNLGEVLGRSGTAPLMQAGAIYTIAGNPTWDPANTPVGGTGWLGHYGGDESHAQMAKFDQPLSLAWNPQDECLYVADYDNQRVRKISRATGIVTTVVGLPPGPRQSNGQGDFDFPPATGASSLGQGVPAVTAQLSYPSGLAFDSRHRLYINDRGAGLIRMVDASGTIRTIAGRYHSPGTNGTDNAFDGDARNYADLYDTEKLDVDPEGNVLLQDYRHGRLRKLWRQWEN
ncbi:MAG: hypothetical protein VKP62_12545 [Candidatus Sericytochromatia bacterium]|nr:hypothetical protein [Candidatus Sericytochromatia bacterium]